MNPHYMHCHVELNTLFGNLDIVQIIFLYLTQYVLIEKTEDLEYFTNYGYQYNT